MSLAASLIEKKAENIKRSLPQQSALFLKKDNPVPSISEHALIPYLTISQKVTFYDIGKSSL